MLLAALTGALALRGGPLPAGPSGYLVSVGVRILAVPATSLAVPSGPRAPGRVDLVLSWPDLGAPRVTLPGEGGRQVAAPLAANLTLALRPADEAFDLAKRAVHLHSRFHEPDVRSNAGGLVMRRFRPDTPFAGKELVIGPPDGRAFVAPCPAAPAARARNPVFDRSLALMRVSGINLRSASTARSSTIGSGWLSACATSWRWR